MKNKTKNFLKGMTGGVLIALLLIGVAKGGNIFSQAMRREKALPNRTTEQKLKEMRMLIDEVYLYDEDIDDKKLQESLIKGYVAGLGDPYSVYYDKEETKELMESTSGEFSGLGVSLTQDPSSLVMQFVQVYEEGAGAKAGLQKGDILYKVDDEDVTGQNLSNVVSKIKGEEGTEVKITVLRGEEMEEITTVATRSKFEAHTVESEMKENRIGYIQITEFDTVTYEQFQKALTELQEQGMQGLVLDVRGNPGGNLDTVCKMLDLILPKGTVVYTENRAGEKETYESDEEHQLKLPMAVLVNGGSASAAEIFAGAIQDYGIGTIVGTTTFGKGIVQQIFPMKDGTSVKLTISEYFTPNGRNIHEKGISPDVELPYEYDEENPQADNQLEEAVRLVREKTEE